MRIQKNQTETGNFRILKELCKQNYFYLRFNRKCCYYTANIGKFQEKTRDSEIFVNYD